jgi:hypothetical protein
VKACWGMKNFSGSQRTNKVSTGASLEMPLSFAYDFGRWRRKQFIILLSGDVATVLRTLYNVHMVIGLWMFL